jgi:hypothetical protein
MDISFNIVRVLQEQKEQKMIENKIKIKWYQKFKEAIILIYNIYLMKCK